MSATVSASQVSRILAGLDLKPHRVRDWLTRRDTPDFWQRAAGICDLYRNPPEGAMLLSIDEKTAIAARSRRNPGRHAAPGRPALVWCCIFGRPVPAARLARRPVPATLTP